MSASVRNVCVCTCFNLKPAYISDFRFLLLSSTVEKKNIYAAALQYSLRVQQCYYSTRYPVQSTRTVALVLDLHYMSPCKLTISIGVPRIPRVPNRFT